jgi:hypothetical protein
MEGSVMAMGKSVNRREGAGLRDPASEMAEGLKAARPGALIDPLKLGPLRLDLPIHPILFALYPVASLLATNVEYLAVSEAGRAALLACLIATASTLLIWIFLRDWKRAALIATPAIILGLSYGHLYSELKLVLGALAVRHRYFAPLLIAALVTWAFVVLRRLRFAGPLTVAFNLAGASALLIPSIALGRAAMPFTLSEPASVESSITKPADGMDGPEGPDIFYIIVDGYGRQDVLLDLYDLDNTAFLRALEQRGFQILEESTTNYNQTVLSLASSLNLGYLDVVLEDLGQQMGYKVLFDLIWHSQVRDLLRRHGYQMVAFRTAFPNTSITDADLFLFPEGQGDEEERSSPASRANVVVTLLFENSAGRILLDFSKAAREAMSRHIHEPIYAEQRERVLFTLASLSKIAELPGRHFVLAHVISPHPPFVFDADGNPLNPSHPFSFADGSRFIQYGFGTREDYLTGYREQLQFLNVLLIESIDNVLAASEVPPIIILQADHGPGAYLRWDNIMESNFEERSGILNALLLPGSPPDVLYPAMSPVNTFSLVLTRYFDADLPPLEDCAYFPTRSQKSRLHQIGECRPPARNWMEDG